MTQNNLASPSDLGRKHDMDSSFIARLLQQSGIKPAYETKTGRGMMRLYEEHAAHLVIEAHKSRVASAVTARRPATVEPAAPPVSPDVMNTLDTLTENVAKLLEQNVLIFRALNSMKDDSAAKLDVIQEAVVELATRPEEGGPTPATATPTPAVRRPKVRVLGLHDNKAVHLQREFGKLLDLAFVNPDRARVASQSQSTGSDATLVLIDFVNHTVTNNLESNGIPHTVIRGGLTGLRTALAELVVAQQETA